MRKIFFDEPKTEVDFTDQLIEIAKIQRELLELRYDFQKHFPAELPVKRTGVFSFQQILPAVYVDKATLLKKKQESLRQDRIQLGFSDGIFWWSLPWEQVIPMLLHNLTFPEEEFTPDEKGRRKGFLLWEQEGRDDNHVICLGMQEHFQRVSSSRSVKSIEHSAYTREERKAMVDAYNNKKDQRAMMHVAFSNNVGVHSISTGCDYNTAYDYYTSAEYISGRMWQSEQYSQSLYTVEEKNTLHVSSRSSNRESVYGICEYHVDLSGRLDYLGAMDFELFYSSEQNNPSETDFFDTKDSIVIGALLLSESEHVKRVPMSIFESRCDCDNYADIVRLAEIMTCLANKLERG